MSELVKALIKFHQQVGKIHKDAKAMYGAYADLSGVLSTVTPVLSANGLAIVQTFLEDSLITELYHTSGEKISSTVKLVVVEGRNKLHSWGASVTYQRRYQICAILGIVADMDTDGVVPEQAAEPAPKKTVKKKAAPAPTPAPTPEPTPAPPAEQPLSKDEYDLVIDLLKKVHRDTPDKLQSLTASFRKKFTDLADLPLSQAITTQAHVAFINDQL
jgi:hypothetical protein